MKSNRSSCIRALTSNPTLYNFIRCFGWVYKWGGGGCAYIWGQYKWNKTNVLEQRHKTYLRNELKLTHHFI